VTLSIPFIAVRLIYALIADFANLQSFSLAYGDTTIYLCMSVIMEIIVTIIAIAFGLTLRVLPKVVKAESNPADTEIEMTTSLREQERKKIHGPVTWIYYNAKDLIRSKRTQADGNY
jgi:Na+-transporting methylmalonyl-CoA/oxaloacetate decarboxylase beta subunit